MQKFEGVANTLFVPLVARINISKRFPEYFYDPKALELEPMLPDDATKGSSEYSNMASVARYYNMDTMVMDYIEKNPVCNVVYLGAGLETAYDRIVAKRGLGNEKYYAVDLPDVIEARRKVFGERPREATIPGDMFTFEWCNQIDCTLPTVLVVSGVFQYFKDNVVVGFIQGLKEKFTNGTLIFDYTNESGLKFTNWFIKRTGNANAIMYFFINDGKSFAERTGTTYLEERTFFTDARKMLKDKLGVVTKVSMAVAEKKKQTMIIQLRLN